MTMTERPGEWVDTAPGLDSFTFTEWPMQITTERYTSREYAEREREAIYHRRAAASSDSFAATQSPVDPSVRCSFFQKGALVLR